VLKTTMIGGEVDGEFTGNRMLLQIISRAWRAAMVPTS
jgi:hypothetical protein